ncbi:MAG: aminotransferase class I/II-fold pyridoxal phosphate-dependent enzyme [Acidobacteriota bacterium]|nr:aminotransferase class I/II-fold pyridoxal phosphate-dependent enzyme [Acidobacteriota bacterium]
MTSPAGAARAPFPVADRVGRFNYAIRNIVAEARALEASGRRVRYLNIGDPVAFGFQTPPPMIAAVERALRDGHNGYGPSVGILPARQSIAGELTRRGFPVSPDRVVVTAGTSEAIELALGALVDPGGEVLVPVPTYPLYTAVLARLDAEARFYRLDAAQGWMPDLDHLRSLITPRTRAIVVIDPNNPTGAVYPPAVRRALIELAETHRLVLLADEVYGDVAYAGPVDPIGSLAPDAPIISCSSLSKGYLAPGWRTGWLAVGRSPLLDPVLAAVQKLADARLCSSVPMQHAIVAAIDGDRSHQAAFRAALHERAVLTTRRMNAIDGISCVEPQAAFYAMPKVALPPGRTDVDYVLGLLRATGVLCVYGSGFNTAAGDGFFRIVFLAPPAELDEMYGAIATFTDRFLHA